MRMRSGSYKGGYGAMTGIKEMRDLMLELMETPGRIRYLAYAIIKRCS